MQLHSGMWPSACKPAWQSLQLPKRPSQRGESASASRSACNARPVRLISPCAAAFAEAEAICTQPCTAVASAVAEVPAVYECAVGDPDKATAAARAQAPTLAPGPLVSPLQQHCQGRHLLDYQVAGAALAATGQSSHRATALPALTAHPPRFRLAAAYGATAAACTSAAWSAHSAAACHSRALASSCTCRLVSSRPR